MRTAVRRYLLLAGACVLVACTSPAARFERRAAALGFSAVPLQGAGFDHRAWVAEGAAGAASPADTLHVYIEHDGTPWSEIDRISPDPTPRRPFALELMAGDSGPRLLLGRPCYFAAHADPQCKAELWTQQRYSAGVVDSMAAALRTWLSAHPYRRVVLIGYSGGGTLAWLMAGKVPETTAVITIAANLDIDAWTQLHQYSPLTGSLNPALQPALPPSIDQLHFAGERDANVPPSVLQSFARRHPGARVIEIPGFDHLCCWIERWPQLLGDQRALP